MRWSFHWNTSILGKHKLSVFCFALWSGSYVIVKACGRFIIDVANPVYSEKMKVKFPLVFLFKCLTSFLRKATSEKCSYFLVGQKIWVIWLVCVRVVDLVSLFFLLQSVVMIVSDVAWELKLLKKFLLRLGIGGYGYRSTKLFGSHKSCYDV